MKAQIIITFRTPIEFGTTDVGALTVTHSSGRNYILDTHKSWIGEGNLTLELEAIEDYDTFPPGDEYNYDLSLEDIQSGELTAALYVSSETGHEVKSITYVLQAENGMDLTGDLTAEQEN